MSLFENDINIYGVKVNKRYNNINNVNNNEFNLPPLIDSNKNNNKYIKSIDFNSPNVIN